MRPRTFTAEDAGELLASPCLFARKFDATVDDEILDMIDDSLRADEPALPLPTRPRAPVPVHLSVPVTQAAFLVS